jgi:hypothetical protein
MSSLYAYDLTETVELTRDELRAIAEDARALAEAEFTQNTWEVGYGMGTTGDDEAHQLHLLRLELGRDLTPAELAGWRAGFAEGAEEWAAFARDSDDRVPPW